MTPQGNSDAELHNRKILIVGITNYRAEDIRRIQGSRSEKIRGILGYKDSYVIIHRDNLVCYR